MTNNNDWIVIKDQRGNRLDVMMLDVDRSAAYSLRIITARAAFRRWKRENRRRDVTWDWHNVRDD